MFQDGDAYVRFFDAPRYAELVKFKHLCKVPDEFKQEANMKWEG